MNGVKSVPWTMPDESNQGFSKTILFADVGVPGEQCLLFCHKPTLELMQSRAGEVFTSITLLKTGCTCCYVYQITCFSNSKIVPLTQVFMVNTEYEAFRNVFRKVKKEFPQFKPNVAYLTMLPSERTAWKEVYPSKIRDKFMDYVLKTIKSLWRLNIHNCVVHLLLESVIALPLLPPSLVNIGFYTLVKQAQKLGVLEEIVPLLMETQEFWIKTNRLQNLSVYNVPFRANNIHIISNDLLVRRLQNVGVDMKQFHDAIQDYGDSSFEAAHGGECLGSAKVISLENDRFLRDCSSSLLAGRISVRKFLRDTSSHVIRIFKLSFAKP